MPRAHAYAAQLKPCPFCGTKAVLHRGNMYCQVQCYDLGCGAEISAGEDPRDVLRKWNGRVGLVDAPAPLSPIPAEVIEEVGRAAVEFLASDAPAILTTDKGDPMEFTPASEMPTGSYTKPLAARIQDAFRARQSPASAINHRFIKVVDFASDPSADEVQAALEAVEYVVTFPYRSGTAKISW